LKNEPDEFFRARLVNLSVDEKRRSKTRATVEAVR
jgi:hypothetical protein